jgi:hypothetical protein
MLVRGFLTCSALVLGLALPLTHSHAADWPEFVHAPHLATGTFSCAATACHGGSKRDLPGTGFIGGEVELWRSRDPHARAGAVVDSQAFHEILERLGVVGPVEGEAYWQIKSPERLQECMNCHNPENVPSRWSPEELPFATTSAHASDALAINCETCHGPAKHWISTHYQRNFDRVDASQFGFVDTKDLVTRGRTCAQCHIGDERHDMNHDMIAAGHPPLRFELASYERALPKHWNDRRQRTAHREYEIKLWLAGQIANYDSGLALTSSRMARSVSAEDSTPTRLSRAAAPRPEFAEYNCSSCHQRLRSPTERGAIEALTETPLTWSGWNSGLLANVASSGRHSEMAAWQERITRGLTSDDAKRYDFAERLLRFRRERFRPTMVDEFPEVFFLRGRWEESVLAGRALAPPSFDFDCNLQLFSLVAAAGKARSDEARKRGYVDPQASAVLDRMRSYKPALAPAWPATTAAASPNHAQVGNDLAKLVELLLGGEP